MDSDTLQTLQKELTCAICMNYFLDPVTIDCGHSFCRPCLCLCWEESQNPMRCPECREISEKTNFKTNFVLRKLAALAREASPPQVRRSEEQICVAHKEVKRLFCAAQRTLLCGSCAEAPAHVTHGHLPVGRAAEQGREELMKTMDSLRKMTHETQNDLNQETSKTQLLAEYVALRKVIIKLQYQKMHLFLLEEEQLHLEALGREAEEIFQQLRDSEVRMTQHKERMTDMYRELTEMCHQPDVELLQDFGNVLERTQSVQMQKPQPVNPELTSWRIAGLLDMLNNFRVDNPLSMEMASCYIRLSEDLRSVIFGDEGHSAPWELQTAESFAAWGAQAFTSGRHYWEVDVTHSFSWVLGVCKDSWTQDTSIIIDSEDAFLLFSLKGSNGYRLSTNSPPLVQCVQRPLGRVGVFLDYDNGTVSFYDVYKAALIYSFLPSSFSSPLRPFLYLCSP
ncbi:putative tripartite motif-containing protein 64B [Lemur catta]|uniref:putative tripartite motif-containing protein 64B n=1 Tax=Lemur catta TaxID=9447 RepID=UPI001E26CA1C|nr:putative tripartite motif-containing protein 64B [Lemur catta]